MFSLISDRDSRGRPNKYYDLTNAGLLPDISAPSPPVSGRGKMVNTGFHFENSEDSDGWNDSSIRTVIPNSCLHKDGTKLRIKLKSGATSGLTLDNIAIVERSGSTANGIEIPTEILFNNTSGVEIPSTNQEVVSDVLEFTIDKTKDYLLVMDVNSSTSLDCACKTTGNDTDYNTYYETANTYNTQNMTSPTTMPSNVVVCLTALEVEETEVVSEMYTTDITAIADGTSMNSAFYNTSLAVYNDKLYMCKDTTIREFDGTTWNDSFATIPNDHDSNISTIVIGNELHIMGGTGASNNAYHDVINLDTKAWSSKAALPTARFCFGLAYDSVNDTIHAIGGQASGVAQTYHHVYDRSANTWDTSSYAVLPTATRQLYTCYNNGFVYAIGGYDTQTEVLRYSISADRWEDIDSLPFNYYNYNYPSFQDTNILDGKVYLREFQNASQQGILVFDLESEEITTVFQDGLTTGGFKAIALMDDKIINLEAGTTTVKRFDLPLAISKTGFGTGTPSTYSSYDVCCAGLAICNIFNGTNNANKAFNSILTDYWESSGTVNATAWVGYSFKQKRQVQRFIIEQVTAQAIDSVKLQYKNDSGVWTDVATITLATDGSSETLTSNNTNQAYEWRLLANNNPSSGNWQVESLSMHEGEYA